MWEGIAFFDLEIGGKSAKYISQIGVWFQQNAWKGKSVDRLEQLCAGAQYLCGHNIFAHDVRYLKKYGASAHLLQTPMIDTLYLSALFFANRPYHKLVKDYLLERVYNDPVEDAKLAQVLLQDCLSVSPEQLRIIQDKDHDKILVGAGPGSGKTRVLVHKVAALLTVEDIKTDQFLMLTFSRPAAQEFKERLYQLMGAAAYYIDIFTYHGYAFRLLDKLGDLQTSKHVIAQAITALQNEDIPTGRIKAKSVIVVDEFQDISEQEYAFLQVLASIAAEVRIIVVGDNDQNIYEFRGASVKFMRSFKHEQQAKEYHLTKNYRACANLVAFSNAFLKCFDADRLKAGKMYPSGEVAC